MRNFDTDQTRNTTIREKKNSFIDCIARIPSTAEPSEVFRELSKLWNDTIGSKWTVLWLRSCTQDGPLWEQVSFSPSEYETSPQPRGYSANEGPVTEYAYQLGSPVFIFDQVQWRGSIGQASFVVCGRAIYENLHSDAFVTIPLSDTNNDDNDNEPIQVSGAICCHVADKKQLLRVREEFTDRDLETMSLLSSSRLRDAVERLHFRLLVKLNKLASEALTKITKDPRADRRRYAEGVGQLVRNATHARAVSIFYRIPMVDEIACIYSTGLVDSSSKSVKQPALTNCRYKLDECRTGKAFGTGKPVILPGTDKSNSQSKYIETFEDGVPSEGSAILQPIPRSSPKSPREGGPKSDGVIRCIGRVDRFGNSGVQDFDSLEAQTLQFIANQVSPVLDTLAVRIRREDQVNIVKHDLLIPAGMIIDSVEELTANVESNRSLASIKQYLLPDLSVASKLLGNLIGQLSIEPESFNYSPRKTWLEGHVVARNKSMLEHFARVTNDVTLKFESFAAIPALWIDPDLFERAFFNLVVNGIKYSQAGTTVQILPFRDVNGFHVDIQNEGRGIEEENRERVFERYFRASNVKKTSGLGLGLFISRAAIEKTGGTLTLERLANPTVFRISFPRSSAFEKGRF